MSIDSEQQQSRKNRAGLTLPMAGLRTYRFRIDKEKALEWLEKGYQERNRMLIDLKVDPHYDPLRSDPRFQNLVRRVGLP